MKILIISANYPPSIGGPAATVPVIATELVKLGNSVDVLTYGLKGYEDKKSNYNLIRAGIFDRTKDNIFSVLKLVFTLSSSIKKLCKNYEYDLIHCHDLNISSLAVILSGVKIKKISKFTGDVAIEFYSKIKKARTTDITPEEFYNRKTLLKKLLLSLQKFIASKVDMITVPSLFIKNELMKYNNIDGGKIFLFRNGAEPVNAVEKRDKNKLFCALKLESKKNVDDAIRSLHFLRKNYRLVIAGNGNEESHLKELAKKEKLENRVSFIGSISHNEVIKHMLSSFAFILPSIYEPASVSLYDAMTTRTPIIATNIGGTPEIVTNLKEGFLVEPLHPEQIASGVKKLEDQFLYEEIQKNEMNTIKRFYWHEHIKNNLIPLYNKLISSKIN
ncbi:D-inositol-3-phosphate glycosyltransferase [Candidatus Tiddalikarchaeum anstoanum]|nr:D-inositol-3-phosphate glycosyltransferase [Candidatus Tiddalikarchaeum anstoanum]